MQYVPMPHASLTSCAIAHAATTAAGTGTRAPNARALTGSRRHLDRAGERIHPVAHIGEPGTHLHGRGVEASAIVSHLELQRPGAIAKLHHDRGCVRVFLHVLQRLEHAEVHRRLDVLRITLDSLGFDGDGNRGLARLRLQRHHKPLVREQRRVDPPRQVTQCLQRFVGIALELIQRRCRLHRVEPEEHLSQPQLHLQCNQVLLRTVMEVAFQAPAFQILRLHQTLPRGAQLLKSREQVGAETDVLEHQPRLMGEIVHQLLLDRCQCLASALGDAQRTEQLTLMAHLHCPGCVAQRRQTAVRHRDHLMRRHGVGIGRCGAQFDRPSQPHRRRLGSGSLLEHPSHARKHLVGGICVCDPTRELAQHLIRGRTLAVDEAVRHLLHALAHRLEPDRHDGCREDRQSQVGLAATPDQRPDPHRDAHVHGGDEHRERAVHQRAADEHVDVVEAVLHHRQSDRHRNRDGQPKRESSAAEVAPHWSVGKADEKAANDHDDRGGGNVGKPSELGPFGPTGAAEAHDHRAQHHAEQHEGPGVGDRAAGQPSERPNRKRVRDVRQTRGELRRRGAEHRSDDEYYGYDSGRPRDPPPAGTRQLAIGEEEDKDREQERPNAARLAEDPGGPLHPARDGCTAQQTTHCDEVREHIDGIADSDGQQQPSDRIP